MNEHEDTNISHEESILKKHNHYIPKMYLDGWADQKKVFCYQLLVPNSKVPLWKHASVENTASLDFLYVNKAEGKEYSELEELFNTNYETPAAEPLKKAREGKHLSEEDWYALIEFVAAQIVRTPAYFFNSQERNVKAFYQGLEKVREKLQNLDLQEAVQNSPETPPEGFPLKVSIVDDSGEEAGITIESFTGKNMWFWEIRRFLEKTSKILHSHQWSIAKAAEGVLWPTSDDPVIRLDWYGKGKYDFGGGIGRKNCEIIMPISPTKALYTLIGSKRSPRPTFPFELSITIKKLICEHALLYVYSSIEDTDIPDLRQRTVDLAEFRRVKNELEQWHKQYTDVEVPFFES